MLTGPSLRHIHRADLHRGLLECAETLGVESFFDCRVIHADSSLPSVTTKDGQQWTADLIVASDGKLGNVTVEMHIADASLHFVL